MLRYDPVSRAYYVEQIFTPILDPSYDPAKPPPTPADYALLFIILALGAILDLSRPPYVPEAEHYHALSRAAMGVEDPPADSLTNVQAMMLMCYYNQLSDDKRAPARVWSLSGLAYKMATAVSAVFHPLLASLVRSSIFMSHLSGSR
jgi:Fungal specific transcription factor domain